MGIEHWMYTLPLRLRSLFRRERVEAELDEEMRYHLDRLIEANVAAGMSEEEGASLRCERCTGWNNEKKNVET